MVMRFSPKRPLKTLKQLKGLIPFGKLIAITRSKKRYIEETGWEQTTSTFPHEWHGFYRTMVGSYKGRIIASTPPRYYIHKPPKGLTTKHSHKACFHLMPDNWCSVHFAIVPKDLDSGVLKLERILYEAYLLTDKTA
jgi:hypothetical protein